MGGSTLGDSGVSLWAVQSERREALGRLLVRGARATVLEGRGFSDLATANMTDAAVELGLNGSSASRGAEQSKVPTVPLKNPFG